jgi:spermidine/putrescine transport system permease protein
MVKKLFARGYVAFILLLVYLPIFILIIFSFTDSANVGTWAGFSLTLYIRLFQNEDALTALGNTLLLGVCSATISTILGTMGAIGVFYSKKKFKKTMEMATQLPIINAEVVIALSLAVLFVAVSITRGFFTLLMGHVVLTIAFVYLSVKPKLQQMDPNTYEAALDLGANPNYALTHVVIPEIMPGILSGFMLALTLSLDDFIITTFLRNVQFETLSTYVYASLRNMTHFPHELRALTTLVFIGAVLVLLANNYISRREASHKASALLQKRRKQI